MALMDFEGHVALIVDSGLEIGRSCVRQILERKAKVLVNVAEGKSTLEDYRSGQVVISHGSPASAVQLAVSKYGRIDSLLFITPTFRYNNVSTKDHNESWSNMRARDLDGAFDWMKAIWPIFRGQGSGRVVFMHIAEKSTMASSASLFGLLGFAQTLSLEGAKYKILANVVMDQRPLFVTGVGDNASSNDIASIASALVPNLLDTSRSDHSGALFEISSHGATKLRWERSRGAVLHPKKNFTPGALLRRWSEVNDFANKTFPEGAIDFQSVLPQALSLPANNSSTEPRFDGKVVIVTGASSGLGRCYALAFARLGASVLVNDLNDPAPTVDEIIASGGKAVGCRASCEDGNTIVKAAVAAFEGVDILINNAGFLRDRAFVNMEADKWKAVLDVHVNGTYQMTQAAWPYLARSGTGAIVNTASTSGIYGVFGQANYSTAKLAILGLSEASASEGRRYGIRVNTIAPVAATGALAAAWANVTDKNKGLEMKPEYNVPAVLLLCSDSANGQRNTITGGLFEIGCGWHAATRLRPMSGVINQESWSLTPESMNRNWKMLPGSVLDNVELRKAIDIVDNTYEYTARDVILYNLSVGAVRSDLALVYEGSSNFQALPTFGIIPFFSREVITHHGELLPNFDLGKSFLGEHSLEVFQYPIPTLGRLRSTGRVLEVLDKGNAAIVRTGYTTYDTVTSHKVFYNEVTFFAGGAGGFGGQKTRGNTKASAQESSRSSRPADVVVQHVTSPEQATLYRLNGDYEALHVDPVRSRRAGFEHPILHGHCTMSIAGKHIFKNFGRIRQITARFIGPVTPGNTLKIEMWKESKVVLYKVSIAETGKVCIGDSYAVLFEEKRDAARM